MIRLGKEKLQKVHQALFRWYQKFGRHDLPWRKTHDPYKIFVSEIMLQQTQVESVIPKYRAFVKQFPSFRALARASTRDVIRAWQGLGYNRRALNLQRATKVIVEELNGKLPNSTAELRKLPGVGPYTAESLRAFVFHAETSALDTNIRRVTHRVFVGPDIPKPMISDAELVELSQRVVPKRRGYDWNSALMDLGSGVCKSKPLCEVCPLKDLCKAYPEILKRKKSSSRAKEPHPKSTPNIPNRIYRGRVVELLRNQSSVSIDKLGPLIKPDFTKSDDTDWLETIIWGLEKDGLIKHRGRNINL